MDSTGNSSASLNSCETALGALIKRFPMEITNQILDYTYPRKHIKPFLKYRAFSKPTIAARSPAYTPPTNGACPIMKLPTELRRQIFAESLPAKTSEVHPSCDDDPPGVAHHSRSRGVVGLLTLNKRISSEVAEVLYEERQFVIHVHEGLKDGGIEFQHAGRQPLQYQDSTLDGRFWKFSEDQHEFGFRRVKKIKVQIFPSQEEKCKHSVINTYFVNLALVRLLERSGGEKNRITSLHIEFMKPKKNATEQQGRAAILRAESYWWDPDNDRPRETSIHGLPNIELVLRPFANLTGCHSVTIDMPSKCADYARIAVFIRDLKASIMSRHVAMFADDDLEMKIESARCAMEEYVNYTIHGTKYHDIDNLNADEVQEQAPEPMDVDSGAEDSSTESAMKKRGLSPNSKSSTPNSSSKKSKSGRTVQDWQAWVEENQSWDSQRSPHYYELDDDEALARAIQESEREADETMRDDEEEAQVQRAIAASIADTGVQKIAQKRHKWTLEALGNDTALEGSSDQNTVSSPTLENGNSSFVGTGRTLGSRPGHTAGTNNCRPTSSSWVNNGNMSDRPWTLPSDLSKLYRKQTQLDAGDADASNQPPAVASTSDQVQQSNPLDGAAPSLGSYASSGTQPRTDIDSRYSSLAALRGRAEKEKQDRASSRLSLNSGKDDVVLDSDAHVTTNGFSDGSNGQLEPIQGTSVEGEGPAGEDVSMGGDAIEWPIVSDPSIS